MKTIWKLFDFLIVIGGIVGLLGMAFDRTLIVAGIAFIFIFLAYTILILTQVFREGTL